MRFLPTLALLTALTASGCDSYGIDTPHPTTPTNPGGGNTGGGNTGGGNTGGGNTGGGGTTTPAKTFALVAPTATYLRTDEDAGYAHAELLSDFGLEAGDTVCFKAVGDFYYYDGLLASTTGNPIVTGAFSMGSHLSAPSELRRIKDVLDGDWFVETQPMYTSGLATEIDEDFDATDGCFTVPAGAQYVFFSVYDDMFVDNTDAMVNGQAFGVDVTRQ